MKTEPAIIPKRRFSAFATMLVILAVLAAPACSPREPATPAPEAIVASIPAAPVAEPEPSHPSPWKVGAYLSLSGQDVAFGAEARDGIDLGTAEVNNSGGIRGRSLEIVYADDTSSTPVAVSEVLKLIDRSKVVALLGGISSSRSRAGGIVANNRRIPMITPLGTNPEVTQVGPFVFRTCFTDDTQAKAAAAFAVTARRNAKVAILFAADNPYSLLLANTFRREVVRLGATVVDEQKFATTDTDFTPYLQQLRSAAPDVIFAPVYYSTMIPIAQQAHQLGLRGDIFLGGDGWDEPALPRDAGMELEGAAFTTHWAIGVPAAASQAFVSSYHVRFKRDPTSVAALAYEATKILADAIERAQGDTPDAIRAAIQETSNFPGVSGAVTMGPGRDPIKPVIIAKIESGHFVYHKAVSEL